MWVIRYKLDARYMACDHFVSRNGCNPGIHSARKFTNPADAILAAEAVVGRPFEQMTWYLELCRVDDSGNVVEIVEPEGTRA